MTDAGATGTRKQREEWAALAALLKDVRHRTRAKPKRPRNACEVWSEHGRDRNESQPKEAR